MPTPKRIACMECLIGGEEGALAYNGVCFVWEGDREMLYREGYVLIICQRCYDRNAWDY